jgi:outer membrane protein
MAEIELDLAEERARKEVRTAESDIIAAEEKLEAAALTLEQAERAYEIAETRYENGLLTQIELLDARLVLTRARVTHLRALHGALLAEASWIRVVGVNRGEE